MYEKELKTAIEAASQSAKILKKGFENAAIAVREKGGWAVSDPVTKFDYEAQKTIVAAITKRFPDHDILSEEGIETGHKSEYRWIIDPLDGTTNFSRGISNFSTSIALEHKGRLAVAVISVPMENSIYSAAKNEGARLSGKPMRVSGQKKLSKALVGVAMLRSREALRQGSENFRKLAEAPTKLRVLGSVAADLAKVACGKMDALIFNHANLWDIAAGILLVKEAGGRVTNLENEESNRESEQMIASNGSLHGSLLKILKTQSRRDSLSG